MQIQRMKEKKERILNFSLPQQCSNNRPLICGMGADVAHLIQIQPPQAVSFSKLVCAGQISHRTRNSMDMNDLRQPVTVTSPNGLI